MTCRKFLAVKAGGTWRITLRLKRDGVERDLTGAEGWTGVRGAIRRETSSTAVEVAFDSGDGTVEIDGGALTFVAPSDVTEALDTENLRVEWVFDFYLYDGSVTPERREAKPAYTIPIVIEPSAVRA
jgi:hypothetical protein